MDVPQFLRLNLRAKLYVSFVCVVLTLGAGVLVAQHLSDELIENLESITGSVVPGIRNLGEIKAATLGIAEAASTVWYSAKERKAEGQRVLDRERAEFFAARDQLRDVIAHYRQLIAQSPEQYLYAEELLRLVDTFCEQAGKVLIAVDNELAEDQTALLIDELEELAPKILLVTRLSEDLEASQLSARKRKAELSITDVVRVSAIMFLLGIGLVGAVGVGLNSNLFRAIIELREAAKTAGAGELSVRVPRRSDDEIGSLAGAFNVMLENLESSTISRQFLESVLAAIADAVVVIDEANCVIDVNDAFLNFTKWKSDEVKGLPLEKFLPGLERLLEKEGKPVPVMQLFGKNTEPVPVSLTISQLATGKAPGGSVLVARDVRAQRRLDAEVRLYREQLERAQQMAALGSVSALLAHQLNQPLTVIQLLLQQSLREGSSPELIESKLNEALSEVRQLSSTLKEVLRFTRPVGLSEESDVSLFKIADKITMALMPSAQEARMDIDFSGLRSLPPIRGCTAEYEEIFFILIENAIHAAPKSRPSRLDITAEIRGSEVFLEFCDTGEGIPSANLDRIFDLFFTTKLRHQGTGLGLGILKQLVTARGGEVRVESELEKGTRFVLQLSNRAEMDRGARSPAHLSHQEDGT